MIKIAAWALYDWANSSFSTIVTTFIFAAYFTTRIAANPTVGMSQWGEAVALAGVIIAVGSPVFGAVADYSGRCKPWLAAFTALCVAGAALLWFAYPAPAYARFTLTAFILGTVGLEIAMVFYNALLPRIAPAHYLGRVSGWAWGLGYFGGLAALIVALVVFVQPTPRWLDIQSAQHIRLCGPLVAVWLTVFALPLFILVPDTPSTGVPLPRAVRRGCADLLRTIKSLPRHRDIFLFLMAHIFYTDGLNTVFAFGGIYAAGTFGMSVDEVIRFGITLNIAAGVGAVALAWMDDFVGAKPTILVSLVGLTALATTILLLRDKTAFWIVSLFLCLFVGPTQAASRSLMARLTPPEKTTEMFGLYAFSGKVTTFLSPWLLALATRTFHSQRAGMGTVLIFFVLGAAILWRVNERSHPHGAQSINPK